MVKNFDTPILFLVFNRPDTTKKVFEQIKRVKPSQLFVAADGPRSDKADEKLLCEQVRQIVLESIDWDCEVHTLFRNENLGCGRGVSEAITWFFQHVEQGIILEDDTIPNTSFFSFCNTLLELYKHANQVMHISGCYFLENIPNEYADESDYYFSKHIHVWGWATWRRAWQYYDFQMRGFINSQIPHLQKYYGEYFSFWNEIFALTASRKINTWDYQWMYAIASNNGWAINPTKNLVTNIGFDKRATHTYDARSKFANIKTATIRLPLEKYCMQVDEVRDGLYYNHYLLNQEPGKLNLRKKIKSYLDRIVIRRTKSATSAIPIVDIKRLKQAQRFSHTIIRFLGKDLYLVDAPSFLGSYKEIFEDEIYKFKSSNDQPLIIDCGANIGMASLYFKRMYPGALVYAYEPDPAIFGALKKNLSSFGFEDVKIKNVAVGTDNGMMHFKTEGGHSGMLVNNSNEGTIPVPVISLQTILSELPVIDFLKIDIEGYEAKVLPAIKSELYKVENLFIEYHSFKEHPQELSQILSIIEGAGFRYYLKEAANKQHPFSGEELFYDMDMLVNIFCFR